MDNLTIIATVFSLAGILVSALQSFKVRKAINKKGSDKKETAFIETQEPTVSYNNICRIWIKNNSSVDTSQGHYEYSDGKLLYCISSSENIVFGRSKDVQIVATSLDTTISKKHFQLSNIDGQLSIVDLNSTNGTYVNGKKIPANTQIEVNAGDIIKAGNTEMIPLL